MVAFRTRGQRAALAFVARAVLTETPPHALLLSGPARVGKSTLARDLAGGLLCLRADPAERPCGACAACRKVVHGNHPDVHVLAPEGAGQQIRLGQVQALASSLALLPLEGRFRIAIIEQAHRLNPDAQHALLKTLEEPPPAVVLALAADDAASLLPTVVSRCARLRLGPVSGEVIADMLAEAGAADRVRGSALARLSGGRPGLALAISRQPEALVIQARLARTLLSLLAADRRSRLAAATELLQDAAALAAVSHETDLETEAGGRRSGRSGARRPTPAERRFGATELLAIWRGVARDLALTAHGGLAELSMPDLLDELAAAGRLVRPAAVGAFVGRLDDVARAVDAYANPELALDVLLLEWPRIEAAA